MHKTSSKEIQAALQELNIPKNRIVIIHSSLFKLGIIEGGTTGIYKCLQQELGDEATIVMPAFSFSFGQSRVWHAKETRSEVGALTEYFRKNIATSRSIHPFHSVSAVGPLAEEITSGHCLSSFGPNSAFQKLYELDAINLSFGTEFIGGATYLHIGEEDLNVPYRFMKPFPGEVRDLNGQIIDYTYEMYCRKISETHEYDNIWNGCWGDLNKKSLFKITHLKGAMLTLSNIRKTLETFKGFLKDDPYYCARKIVKKI
jgi:aminoglycoside 3-N-acetyltransferase